MNFSDRNKSDYLYDAVKITSQRHCDELDREHPEDICGCGDYRKNHPNNGPCSLNGLGHGAPMPRGDCLQFRLAYGYWANYDIYDELWETEDAITENL